MPARSTFGDHSAALPFIASTWRTPSAAALRRMVPTLPGSCSRSSTTVATPGSGCWPLEGRSIRKPIGAGDSSELISGSSASSITTISAACSASSRGPGCSQAEAPTTASAARPPRARKARAR